MIVAPLVAAVLFHAPIPAAAPLRSPLPAAVQALGAPAIDGNKILAEVDRRAAAFQDQSYDASMAIYRGGTLQKTLQFRSVMKGLDRQLIEFIAPGDVSGMKVLMENADTLYVYMPEFKKVRRVAAHVRNQGFLGSEFTYDDMTQVKLSPFFEAQLHGKKGNLTTLLLTAKKGVQTDYSKLEVIIDGSKGGVTEIRYFDGAGNHVRTQVREDWKKVGGKTIPTRVSMKNLKTGDVTQITLSNILVDQGVDDSKFSRRTLLR